jgi:hypothetical protein
MHAAVVNFSTAHGSVELREISTPAIGPADVLLGIRPTRIVRVRPADWPNVRVPREEYLGDGTFGHEDRFPTPAISPKY